MKRIRARDLVAVDRLVYPLLHESGEALHEAGDPLTEDHIDLLQECGIEAVYDVDNPADRDRLLQRAAYRTIQIADLVDGATIASPIYSPSRVLLLQANVPISEAIRTRLQRRGYSEVLVKRSAEELRLDQVEAYRKGRRKIEGVSGILKAVEQLTAELEQPGVSAAEGAAAQRERRRFPRYPGRCKGTFILQRRFSSIWEDAVHTGVVRDISKGGIRLATSIAVGRGQKIKISIEAGDRGVRIGGIAEVVRVETADRGVEVGCRFLYVGAERVRK